MFCNLFLAMGPKRDLLSLIGMSVVKKISEVENVWEKNGYFNDSRPGLLIRRENFLENALAYLNQARKTVQSNRAIYLCDCEILGQIIEVSERPVDIENYQLKNREVKYLIPQYSESGDFVGVY